MERKNLLEYENLEGWKTLNQGSKKILELTIKKSNNYKKYVANFIFMFVCLTVPIREYTVQAKSLTETKVIDLENTIEANEHVIQLFKNVLVDEVRSKRSSQYLNKHRTIESRLVFAEQSIRDETSIRHVIVISSYVLGLAVGLLMAYIGAKFLRRHRKKKRIIRNLEFRLSLNKSIDYEIFYIDLNTGRVVSNKHFSSLLNKKSRKSLKLNELSDLTGYDYLLHYKNIMFLGEDEFLEEYDLDVDGVKQHFIETGVYQNGLVVTALAKSAW